MNNFDYEKIAEKLIYRLKNGGIFLVGKQDDITNVMTIGYAALGRIWKKPIVTIAVKRSRFTFDLINNTGRFTITIPNTDMKEILKLCGTSSGRDCNKFNEFNLKLNESKEIDTPVLDVPGIHCECKVLYKNELTPNDLSEDLKRDEYLDNEYHVLFFGEILNYYNN